MKEPKNTSIAKGIDEYHNLNESADPAEHLRTIYADWADAYDADNDDRLGTVSQPLTVEMLTRHVGDPEVRKAQKILDLGCGTGLVGVHLLQHGFSHIEGADISQEMMAHARERGYADLHILKDGEPLPFNDGSFDIVTCVGVFTHGHLPASALDDILRIIRPGGLVCFTINEGVWESGKFAQKLDALSLDSKWELLEQNKQDYMVREGVKAWYITARVC